MRHYDTVIFDLDGTLLDTLEDLTDSVNFTMALYGYPLRTVGEVRQFVGNGAGRLIELSIPGGTHSADYTKSLEAFRRHYTSNMQNKTKPYDGIVELLRELTGQGCRIAVVSNKIDTAVKGLCRIHFGENIQAAIGDSERVIKKPSPDMVFEALRELGSSANRAIYVGDSEVDAETAQNAGLPLVGVTWGFRDRGVLESAGADYIINKPDELMSIVGR
jgi:phosphoglycolate phosphatase